MTEKMYEMVCKDRFDKIDADNKEIKEALLGNGHAGLSERVRTLEKAYSKIMAGGIFLLCAVGLQLVDAAFVFIKNLLK